MRRLFILSALSLVACGGSSSSPDGSSSGTTPDGSQASMDGGVSPSSASSSSGASGASGSSGGPGLTGQCTGVAGGSGYSKYKKAFFGNLHQHTSYSLDAYEFGTRAAPADAYGFAKGTEGINTAGGSATKTFIDRPLDFLAVTDHSEWLGVTQTVAACAGKGDGSTQCQTLLAEEKSAWEDTQQAAADALDPCKFTSLVAYEWTSMPDDGSGTNTTYNNHHNVLFGTTNVPIIPLDSDSYPAVTDLFTGLDAQCTGTCSALVVPHNSNLSEGKSLALPATIPADQLADMQKYEKLVEIYQHKGSSECFYDPNGSTDPDCAFEYLKPGDAADTPQSYVRTALENGMDRAIETNGANPLQLGIISSTDDHNAIAGLVNESQFIGHLGITDSTPGLRLGQFQEYGPGGLAAVWAQENTRDSIFAALNARETYGTSGPRIQVRFYETSSTSPCTGDFPATIVDGGAVAMGSTFKSSTVAAGAAHFAIGAWPDDAKQPLPDGTMAPAGLQTVQVIKAHGKAGAAVVEDVPVSLPIAAAGACMPWTDTSYDPTEQSFYYVRVLQVPTYRWSHFDCQQKPDTAGCEAGGTLDVTIKERAWSSPIWATP